MTDTEPLTPKLELELETIRRWREERQANYQRDLDQIDEEGNRLHLKLLEIQRKLNDNNHLREQVLSQLRQLPLDEGRRSHNVLVSSIVGDRLLIAERAGLVAQAVRRQNDDLQEMLDQPSIAETIAEFESFKELEPVLGTMPASYRKAVLDHHEAVRKRLQPVFELADGASPTLDVPVGAVSVICSLDPEEGSPTAFAVILPIEHAIYRDWVSRPEDLQSQAAFAVVAAVNQVLARAGAPNAPVAFRVYEDSLAIQVWLGGQAIKDDIRVLATETIEQFCLRSPDLKGARLRFKPVWVSPFAIAPDEDVESAADDLDPSDDDSEAPSATDRKPTRSVQVGLRRNTENDEP